MQSHTITIQGRPWATTLSFVNAKTCVVCMNDFGGRSVCKSCPPSCCNICRKTLLLKKQLTCPTCRTSLERRSIVEEKTAAERMVQNELESNQYHCQQPGCGWQGSYNLIKKHTGFCKYDEKNIIEGSVQFSTILVKNFAEHTQKLENIKALSETCRTLAAESDRQPSQATINQLLELFPLVTTVSLHKHSPLACEFCHTGIPHSGLTKHIKECHLGKSITTLQGLELVREPDSTSPIYRPSSAAQQLNQISVSFTLL